MANLCVAVVETTGYVQNYVLETIFFLLPFSKSRKNYVSMCLNSYLN